ncbi:phage tail assembly protein [Falsiroseomonas sp. CW058]|uniref:phage tail assembly protein n=1 Tax=Falsiroseomonas sp. CW058 TaxID=3388664 RepID=UPI003D31CE7A
MDARSLTDAEDVIEEIPPRTVRFPAVEYNGTTWTEITLRPLTIEMILAAQRQKGQVEQAVAMMVASAGIPPQLAVKMSPKVLEHASEYFARFLPNGPMAAGDAPPPG